MKKIETLLVTDIKFNCELMIESIKNGETSESCEAMEAVRALSQFALKLVENNHLELGLWVEDLKKIAELVSETVEEDYDDSSIAEEGLNEIGGLINVLER